MLKSWLGTDQVSFSVGSEGVNGVVRSYTSLWDAAVEVADSRVYGGVHFNKSGTDGISLGITVAREVIKVLA